MKNKIQNKIDIIDLAIVLAIIIEIIMIMASSNSARYPKFEFGVAKNMTHIIV